MEEGTFVPDGRNDILTEAIGTAEHGGRVRGVGQNHTLSTFFGRSSSRQRQVIDVQEQIAQITSNVEARIKSDLDKKFAEERKMIEEERKMFAEERKMMQQSFMDTLKSMGLSQTSEINKVNEPASPKVVVTGSAKGSCSPAYEKDKQDVDIRNINNDNDNVKKLLLNVLKMGEDHLTVQLTHCHCVVNFLMSAKCIRELLVGFNWLDVGTLSVWCS
jgi:hypothetical protein